MALVFMGGKDGGIVLKLAAKTILPTNWKVNRAGVPGSPRKRCVLKSMGIMFSTFRKLGRHHGRTFTPVRGGLVGAGTPRETTPARERLPVLWKMTPTGEGARLLSAAYRKVLGSIPTSSAPVPMVLGGRS